MRTAPAPASTSERGCPKRMMFGPCGGVRGDATCEVDARPCPFVELGGWATEPPQQEAPASPIGAAGGRAPTIVVDVRVAQDRHDAAALWSATAAALAGCVALLGEHVDNPRRHDDAGAVEPAEVVATFARAGTPCLVTVTGRDRTMREAATLIEAYRDAGASAIHCVTGDHPAALGLDRAADFGAEAMTLAALAARSGIAVTVGESPASPGDRVARVLAKQRAGASVCILNHGGDVDDLVRFVDRSRAAGATLDFIAPIPMVADARAAGALTRFPGLALPTGYLDAIVASDDPYETGLRRAAAMAGELAASGRFAGIDLSGSARDGDPWQRIASTVEFVERVRDSWAAAAPADR